MPLHLILPVYFVVWWITLFFLLPIGVKTPEKPDKFHYAAAPEKAYMKKKILWNFPLAAFVTLLIHFTLTIFE